MSHAGPEREFTGAGVRTSQDSHPATRWVLSLSAWRPPKKSSSGCLGGQNSSSSALPRPRPIAHPAPRLPPPAHLQRLLPTSRGGRGVPLISEDSAVSVSRRCARCLSTIQKRTLEPPLTVLFGYYSFFFCFFSFFAMHSIIEQNVPSSSPSSWWGGDRGESISLWCVPLPAPISEVNWNPPGSAGAFSTAFYWSEGIF